LTRARARLEAAEKAAFPAHYAHGRRDNIVPATVIGFIGWLRQLASSVGFVSWLRQLASSVGFVCLTRSAASILSG
jgi:hypothetical protein